MKRWLLHTLFLVALFGHIGHSFHEHHHEADLKQCKICIVDDLSKITTDHYTAPTFTHFHACAETLQDQHAVSVKTALQQSRAPPSC